MNTEHVWMARALIFEDALQRITDADPAALDAQRIASKALGDATEYENTGQVVFESPLVRIGLSEGRAMADLPKYTGRLTPRAGWDYVGCPVCGGVTTAPVERMDAEGMPYCVHNGSSITWKNPFVITGWTKMVRVDVEIRA